MTRLSILALVAIAIPTACGSDDDSGGDDVVAATSDPSGPPGTDDFAPDEPMPKADLGVDPPVDCTPYCEVRSDCLGEASADCLLACTDAHEHNAAISTACLAAFETLLGCVASLSCDEAGQYQTGVGDYPCAEQELAIVGACAGDEPAPAVCEPLCTTAALCTDVDPGECTTLCAEALANADTIGDACLAAQTAVFECVAALSCDEYDAWSEAGADYPCQAQDDELFSACESR